MRQEESIGNLCVGYSRKLRITLTPFWVELTSGWKSLEYKPSEDGIQEVCLCVGNFPVYHA